MLSSAISRCKNKECKLPCRRKESSNSEWLAYTLFKIDNNEKCEYQIKPLKDEN